MEQVQTTVRRGWEKWGREIRAKARREALDEGMRLGADTVLDLVRSRLGAEAAAEVKAALGAERIGERSGGGGRGP